MDLAWYGLVAEHGPALASIVEAAGFARGNGMQADLAVMAVRLLGLRRLLKQAGSLYLHGDTTANAY